MRASLERTVESKLAPRFPENASGQTSSSETRLARRERFAWRLLVEMLRWRR